MVPSVANPCAMPMPKPMSCPHRRHVSSQGSDGVTHFERHQHSLKRRVVYGNRIVENNHYAVTGITLKRSAVLDDDLANRRMVVTQQRHYVFWVRAFGEAGEATQVAEERGNLSTMAFELLLSPGCDDQISYLRGQETSQPAHALDFAYLVGDALFEVLV